MSLNIPIMINFNITHFEKISHYILTGSFIFYLIFGNIGNILKILFFLQKPLKRCPCTIYILFSTISHFFTLNNIPLLSLLSNDSMIISFGSSFINGTIIQNSSIPSNYSIKMCKIRNYFHTWSSIFSLQVLVFASMNRFFMTIKKKNSLKKQPLTDFFSNLSTAYILCLITCFISAFISLHNMFSITIKYNNICTSHNTILWAIGLTSLFICQLILMIIFGTLTILCRQKRAVWIRRKCRNDHEMIPMFNQLCQYCRHHRSERHHVETQLTSMIITEIICVILTLLPYTIYIVYRLITIKSVRNSIELMYENIIERLIQLTIFFEPSCGFYIYLFSLTTLKKRFLNIFWRRLGIT